MAPRPAAYLYPGKRWPSGGVQGGVPRDPRDMAKAGLLQAQSPAVNVRTHRNDAWNRCRVMSRHEPVGRDSLCDAEPRPARAVKEMSGRPTSRSTRTAKTYRGIAYGARALWRRSARSSRCAMRCTVVLPAHRAETRGDCLWI